MRRIAAVTVFCLLPLAAAIAEEDISAELSQLPVLPVSAVKAADAAARKAAPPVAEPATAAASMLPEETKRELIVTPGMNEIVTVAVGHTNRILMPFDTPRIRTTSDAGLEVEGRAIYLTTNEEGRPVTMFVSDATNPELTLSLTFVGKRIPPVQVEMKLDSASQSAVYRPSKKAQAWEESQPYVNTIREVLRDVAIGKTPQGYSLSEAPSYTQLYDGCRQSGLLFSFEEGQVLEGHRLRVNIGVVENKSRQPIELREPSCAGTDVRAVAAYPNPLLQPGEKSEIYVVRGIDLPEKAPHNARRSLLQE